MVIVAGTLEVDPAKRDAFLRDREASMCTSRAEPGCITYVLSADPIDPGIVNVFERWESEEALATHLAGLAAAPRPADNPVTEMSVVQYEIASEHPLGG
jgi:quinol monooxygenase YgiN